MVMLIGARQFEVKAGNLSFYFHNKGKCTISSMKSPRGGKLKYKENFRKGE